MTKIFSSTSTGFCILILASVLIAPVDCPGHAFLDHAEPKVGTTTSTLPQEVRIWFDAALEPAFSKVTVQNAEGKRVDKGDAHVDSSDPNLLIVSLPALGPGMYRVLWNIAARDGHRTSGDYTFTITK